MHRHNQNDEAHDANEAPPGFRVEIETDETETNLYIYHTDYLTKMFMFGLLNKDIKDEWHLRDIIAANIEEYKALYREKFMN